ncbi:MAG: oligosaccharide flippase family protein [Anaerolineae bacterium]|nr:oligosaccharide flippase family protein [Anaerolineae bacterium]
MDRLRRFSQRKFVRDTLILQTGKISITFLSLISTILVTRLLGPQQYGLYALADNLFVLFTIIDISGAAASTNTRMSRAIGAGNEEESTNVLAYGLQSSVFMRSCILLLVLLIGPAFASATQGDASIGMMAIVIALGGPMDAIYSQLLLALQARRSMMAASVVQTVNQVVLTCLMISAVLIAPQAESLAIARLLYSLITLVVILIVYIRLRAKGSFALPRLSVLVGRVFTQSPRPFWRFGLANAIDKNISNISAPLIMQIVGAFGGSMAAGYLGLAMRGVQQVTVLGAAVLENLNAAIPQAIGRGDYQNLRRNFARVQGATAVYNVALFGAMALTSPLLVPVLFGTAWRPAIPAVVMLAIYGMITGIGGNFAPLYRAFGQMKLAIGAKIAALAIALPTAALLVSMTAEGVSLNISLWSSSIHNAPYLAAGISASSAVAAAGALSLNILYAISVGLTAIFTIRELNKRASIDRL